MELFFKQEMELFLCFLVNQNLNDFSENMLAILENRKWDGQAESPILFLSLSICLSV